jgi:mannose-1-phosphate guanylyltransferase
MLIERDEIGMIPVLRASTKQMTSADFLPLDEARSHILEQGRSALLVDLSGVRKITKSGIGALAEFATSFPHGFLSGFVAPPSRVADMIAQSPVGSLIPLFPSQAQAINSQPFRRHRLAGTRAVVLCAGAGSRMAPLTRTVPKPMLDFLGRPILDHILDHLGRFGIRDIFLNPGHNAQVIHQHFAGPRTESIFFLNEGRKSGGVWQAEPLGSASTLARLFHRHCAFADDFFVLCGDALIDLDLAAMHDHHRRTGAMITIAARRVPSSDTRKYGMIATGADGRITAFQEKPHPDQACSDLASTGVYLMNPAIFDFVEDTPGQDIGTDLLPLLLQKGVPLHAYDSAFSWTDIGCGRDLACALFKALEGSVPGVLPAGREIRPGLWAAEGAWVSSDARIEGPCYVGRDAVIEKSAHIEGPAVIGDNCFVEGQSLIRKSILFPDTYVRAHAWVDRMIASGHWAVAHEYADGTPRSVTPLERVGPRPGPESGMPAIRAMRAGGAK